MENILSVAVGGGLALAGAMLSALVTLTIQRRQSTALMRLHLFEKQLEAHATVAKQLGVLHFATMQSLATFRIAGGNRTQAARDLNDRGLETMRVLDDNSFYLDRTAGEAVLNFVVTCHRVRDGEVLTPDEVGIAYGRALAVCHEALTIPDLARATYREGRRLRPREWAIWRRRRKP